MYECVDTVIYIFKGFFFINFYLAFIADFWPSEIEKQFKNKTLKGLKIR
jgi:hypothetical protein